MSVRRLSLEASQPPDAVIVVGAPSSCTRLVARWIAASGVRLAVPLRGERGHDPRHGARRWTCRVVRVTRDPEALAESQQARWDAAYIAHFPTAEQLAADYPDAITVSFEDLRDDLAGTTARVAAALGVEPWSFTEPIYDANAEPGSREVR